jgi:excisionase family DNA binding protein
MVASFRANGIIGGDSAVEKERSTGRHGELLTAGEVGERLRLPLSTVYYLAKEGKLRGFRVGRSWRFPAGAIGRLQEVDEPLILVVDTHKPIRSFVTRVLQSRGCCVEEAGDMNEALTLAGHNHFDVLLIDLTVLGGDDTDRIRELMRNYSPDQVIAITAAPAMAPSEALLDLGAVTLLPKPLSVEPLVACVERIAGVQLALTTEANDGTT